MISKIWTLHSLTLSTWSIFTKLFMEEDLTPKVICTKLEGSSCQTTISMVINDIQNVIFAQVDPFDLDLFSPKSIGSETLGHRLFMPSFKIVAQKLCGCRARTWQTDRLTDAQKSRKLYLPFFFKKCGYKIKQFFGKP